MQLQYNNYPILYPNIYHPNSLNHNTLSTTKIKTLPQQHIHILPIIFTHFHAAHLLSAAAETYSTQELLLSAAAETHSAQALSLSAAAETDSVDK